MRRRSIKGERRKERGKEERGVVWERERYIYIQCGSDRWRERRRDERVREEE